MSKNLRPQFGNRDLKDECNVFEHNAWDNVTWNEERQEAAKLKIKQNSEKVVPSEEQEKYEREARLFWDEFYKTHRTGFFKDRHWLFTEFPEICSHCIDGENEENGVCKSNEANVSSLANLTAEMPTDNILNSCKKAVLEVGCGAGNSVFPILETCEPNEIFVYCCDFSEVAVSLVKSNPEFDPQRCHPFLLDLISDSWDVPFSTGSLDYILLIFVLSAIHPEKMQSVVSRLVQYLKPGGRILFRDYGKYDMVELRFKPGHCLSDHYYVRGDGTKVYFFSEEEVHELFSKAGLCKKQNLTDRRLQVNRGKLLTMYRVWIQAVYEKPVAC